MLDKYGSDQDPYCYPGTSILKNRLNLISDGLLAEAERALSEVALSLIEFAPPPYDLPYLKYLHRLLFADLYDWAGELRTVDISKGNTRFCTTTRIEPEAKKIFAPLADANWLQDLEREQLVNASAVAFGDLNVIHPFREGNGRAQRVLFEHLITNAGYEISWWAVGAEEWTQANIHAVDCEYGPLINVFERCIGKLILSEI
ncbi:putative adenosine monophosphate-protein transferase Fic [Pseudomonas syringae]|uniref:protein adenylyltransferase n=1 Tax=Pseudomonas syringae TaxID=317 RepID=A0A9Q4A7K9_PSESX|nr:putative adenosine monophosphate-protein transferase Fic [Pseudomonas syringae]MCF5468272.1 putative adenosine monophosphate-protein transferase Fic [Pseudomonas syringae]MCF5472948.1 putative adenosine monophosphate-protein transferase Fic [Pseudomonas syringae]MCF5482963.1 putative adenosine monophosphate-protein transferase Fic [Pseudomonas syringae]MCF5490805.1 putative adenosine monophosphate-protein transferase Fic [Pseudomonas syringae]MCF5495592.1 putative adenosine monophosphate-pr